MQSPADRRLTAIKELTRKYINKDGELKSDLTREEVAKEIEKLLTLGRSVRWHNAIKGWASMIRDDSNGFHWAFVQGSIFAAHAA